MSFSSLAQLSPQHNFEQPVTWQLKAERVSDNQVQLIFKSTVEDGWYVYSQKTEDGGPIPLEFNYEEDNNAYTLEGETSELAEKVKAGKEPLFDNIDVVKLYGDGEFKQLITIKDTTKKLKGEFSFQTCKEVCLPPENIEFALDLGSLKTALGEKNVNALLGANQVKQKLGEAIAWPQYDEPVSDCENKATVVSNVNEKGKWSIFLIGILGGLVALLTPCVFPMIPLTVTFFTKRHEKKAKGIFEAVLYGFFIFLVYFLLALPFLIFKLPKDTLYRISTSPILNIAFFLIFMFFALSLFGFYELTLPSKWANKTDEVSNKGGIVGIFFMALTLAIVSFSCTGPILGGLMASSLATEGGQLKLVYGMSGFGLALGLPFALFAMFPGILKKLPKSGSWMNTVKVFLGFVEVALALKFLSMADLVNQWGILKYEIFIAIWVFIAIGLALYMFGVIRFPHDSPKQKISLGRKVIGALAVLAAFYISADVFTNKINLFGFPPPKYYSLFNSSNHNENTVLSFEEGIAKAKSENKPIMLDFTGWSCVNCRDVEKNIWTDPEVKKRLENEVIVVSLYADERKKLEKEQQYDSDHLNKKIKTIGDKWTDFEAASFGKISQPLYAIVSADGQLMNNPISHTKSVQDYIDFLDCGTFAYKNQ